MRLNLKIWYSNITDLFLFFFVFVCFFHSEFNLIPWNSVHAIFIVDPLTAIQAGTIWRGKVHVHFWWIVHVFPYSIWIESLFEGQWFSSVRVFPAHSFSVGRISSVFTPYFSSASRMTRLDDLESWWRWISLSLPSLLFLGNSVMKKDNDLLLSGYSCKISTFPRSQPFHVFDILVFHCMCFELHFPLTYFNTHSTFDLFLFCVTI